MSKRELSLKTRVVADAGSGQRRLRAWISCHQCMDPAVFVYQRCPALPGEPAPDDRFVNVASASDMADYPCNAPADGSPFFRLPHIDIVFRSAKLLCTTVDRIVEDLTGLVASLDSLDELGTAGQYDIGGCFGVRVFTNLLDVPRSYAGQAGRIVAVKAGENGLEFIDNEPADPWGTQICRDNAVTHIKVGRMSDTRSFQIWLILQAGGV